MSDMRQVHEWFRRRDYGYALRLGVIGAVLLCAPFVLHLLHRTATRLGDAGRRSTAGLRGHHAALPLLMLTVVVYFTGDLWQLAARMTRERLWEVIGFLAVVALLFVVATIRDEVRALRDDRAGPGRAGPRDARELFQVVFFTAGLFVFFLALGVNAIPDDVAVLWSSEQTCAVGQPPCAGTWFGIHVPVPQTVVHTSLFVAASLAGRDAYLELETRTDRLTRRGEICR